MNTLTEMYYEKNLTSVTEARPSEQKGIDSNLKKENAIPIAFLNGKRYRAKVSFVSPKSKRSSFESETVCFLGVSLENRNFTPARFHSLVEWVSRRFRKCQILIGDRIHRITLETSRGVAPNRALLQATELGKKFMADHQQLLNAYKESTTFEYVTCGSIQDTNEYTVFYAALQRYFDTYPAFRSSVEAFGYSYHRHHWDTLSDDDRAIRLQRSSQYFLEEFAVFSCLSKRGVNVMVYPGSFSTLAEIASGDFPEILAELQALTVVSLTLKRR